MTVKCAGMKCRLCKVNILHDVSIQRRFRDSRTDNRAQQEITPVFTWCSMEADIKHLMGKFSRLKQCASPQNDANS